VHGHPLPRPGPGDEPAAAVGEPDRFLVFASQAEPAGVPGEAAGPDHGVVAGRGDDLGPPDAAAVEDMERMLGLSRGKQSRPGIDAEDVERVRRGGFREQLRGEVRPVPAGSGGIDPLEQPDPERGAVYRVEQRTAGPVGAHDPLVERVADAGEFGEHRQVRPHAGEPGRDRRQGRTGGSSTTTTQLEQGGGVRGAAVAEVIGGVRVAGEQSLAWWYLSHGPAVPPGERLRVALLARPERTPPVTGEHYLASWR
jgi:hypothetical protein